MSVSWVQQTINLQNKHALHMRPAQRIVETAGKFGSDVVAVKDGMECNAKSILEMIDFVAHMALHTPADDQSFVFKACGDDAPQALKALAELVNDRFGLE